MLDRNALVAGFGLFIVVVIFLFPWYFGVAAVLMLAALGCSALGGKE